MFFTHSTCIPELRDESEHRAMRYECVNKFVFGYAVVMQWWEIGHRVIGYTYTMKIKQKLIKTKLTFS